MTFQFHSSWRPKGKQRWVSSSSSSPLSFSSTFSFSMGYSSSRGRNNLPHKIKRTSILLGILFFLVVVDWNWFYSLHDVANDDHVSNNDIILVVKQGHLLATSDPLLHAAFAAPPPSSSSSSWRFFSFFGFSSSAPPPPMSHSPLAYNNNEALPRPVRLLRIPKAGSSSFSAFLRLQYKCVSPPTFPAGECHARNADACPEIQGCFGHVFPHEVATPDLPVRLTMVREPVARYISAYRYMGHHGRGTKKNITLHADLFPEYDNTMTNYLSHNPIGTWGTEPQWHVLKNSRKGDYLEPDYQNNPRTTPPPIHTLPTMEEMNIRLTAALTVIGSSRREHLAQRATGTYVAGFVGVLEFWNDSLRLFCRMYQCPNLQQGLLSEPERVGGTLLRGANNNANATFQPPTATATTASTTTTATIHNNNNNNSKSSLYPWNDARAMQRLQQSHVYDLQVYQAAKLRFCTDLNDYRAVDVVFEESLSAAVKTVCDSLLAIKPPAIVTVAKNTNITTTTAPASTTSTTTTTTTTTTVDETRVITNRQEQVPESARQNRRTTNRKKQPDNVRHARRTTDRKIRPRDLVVRHTKKTTTTTIEQKQHEFPVLQI